MIPPALMNELAASRVDELRESARAARRERPIRTPDEPPARRLLARLHLLRPAFGR
jgi:hypothetical protein